MRKSVIAMVLLLLPAVAAGAEDDFSDVTIKVHKVAGSVYMLEGAGGNIGVSVGDDGIVIVDDQFAPLAERIRAALKGITDAPVRFVINTHWHGDHVGGNLPFGRTSTIIAQDNVRRRMATGGSAGNLGSVEFKAEAAPAAALPILTFGHDVTLHLNGEEIRALHIPSGHTDGDSVVFFTRSNVVHLGDDFVTYGFPFIDLDGGGSVRGLIKGLEALMKQLPDDVAIIPGHGSISKRADLPPFITMLKETVAAVEKEMQRGRTLEQMREARILERWAKWSGEFVDADRWLETLHNELSGRGRGEYVPHN